MKLSIPCSYIILCFIILDVDVVSYSLIRETRAKTQSKDGSTFSFPFIAVGSGVK